MPPRPIKLNMAIKKQAKGNRSWCPKTRGLKYELEKTCVPRLKDT